MPWIEVFLHTKKLQIGVDSNPETLINCVLVYYGEVDRDLIHLFHCEEKAQWLPDIDSEMVLSRLGCHQRAGDVLTIQFQ